MKIKELQKTVNVAWSPAQQNPIMLAAGTAAQQLDASSNALLEIYAANLTDPGYDLVLKGSHVSPYRFHKIVWSPLGFGGQYGNGVIAGGCEGGHLLVYNAQKLLSGDGGDALVVKQDKHTGPVRAIDFNSFQSNLLASGASESEILIWDLNNTTTPMTPGTKTQPFEDIQNVSWNKQVQHILASVFSSRCVIWDLRKNEPIIKLSDSQSRVRWHAIQWHPDVATQLWLASEEDQAPVVQLWDLRYATAPAKTLQIHQRGVLGLSWCPKDTDLMISCGKDNKILCWNPNTEVAGDEILSEVASTIQWYSDVQWCPKNPAIIASSSLDGIVSIYSLNGGVQQQVQTSRKIADSFPGMDTFADPHLPQNNTAPVAYSDLRKPPKWMKRPIGASFGFGGKLISFNNTEHSKIVNIQQIITEPELIERSNKLENVLANGNFKEYCTEKCQQIKDDEHSEYIWRLLSALFDGNSQHDMLNVFGYNAEQVQTKLLNWFYANYKEDGAKKDLSRSDSSEVEGDASTEDSTDLSGAGDNNSLFDGMANDLKRSLNDSTDKDGLSFKIKTNDDDDDGMICQALLTGNIEMAVNLCMNADRYADAIIIAMTGSSELLARTQHQYLKKRDGYLSHIISALVTKDWMGVVNQCSTDSWKDALVAVVTHSGEHMPILCERLADRLLTECKPNDSDAIQNAILCLICAGNVEKLVETWPTVKSINLSLSSATDNVGGYKEQTKHLQELVEIVMLLQKAVELQGRNVGATGKFADLLSKYAGLLAAQGALNSALAYLGPSDDPEITNLRDRLYYALGHKQAYAAPRVSQTQNLYNKSQSSHNTGNNSRFGQQRQSSVPNVVPAAVQHQQTSFSSYPGGAQQQPPSMFNNSATSPQSWNNTQSTPQVQSWNSKPIVQQQPSAAISSFMPPQQAAKPVGPPPIGDSMMQPARPPSVGSQATTRSKYVLDPSVQSNTGYGQTSNLYTPQSTNMYNAPISNQQPTFNSGPIQNHFTPFTPTPIANSTSAYLSGVAPIELAQQAMPSNQSIPPPPLSSSSMPRNPTPPSGWNDPPALKSRPQQVGQYSHHKCGGEMSAEHAGTRRWNKIIKSHSNSSKCENIKQQTNTANAAFGFNQDATVPQIPNGVYDPTAHQPQYQQQQQPQLFQPQQQQVYQPQQQQQPHFQPATQQGPPQMGQMNFQTSAIPQAHQQQPPLQQQQPPQQSTPTPEPIKQKLPIPEEYVYMQTVFDELRVQCINSASNPQTKRKLEDVAKRLECLYDLLRENRLTQNTLTSLVQLVQYIQIGDYANGLGLHTQMVSGPDFSQIASFMPGIKVLVQSALQLQVYLR